MNTSSQNLESINLVLLQWAKDHLRNLEARGISLEIMDHTKEIEEKKLQDPVQVVFFSRKERMGEMRAWMSGIVDMEILDEGGKNIYYNHYDMLQREDFEEVIQKFIHHLCE